MPDGDRSAPSPTECSGRGRWLHAALTVALLAAVLPAFWASAPAVGQEVSDGGSALPLPLDTTDQPGIATEVVVRKLAQGFAVTLGVAAASIAGGFLLAIPVGALLNHNRGLSCRTARIAVDFIRGTPVLVQLYVVYYLAPSIGLSLKPIASAIITLSINATAYMAEVIRSGLMSVDPGQQQAGRALGLSHWQVFWLIVWPQAFRIAVPPLVNSVVALIKDTALVSIITVPEVIHVAKTLGSVTFQQTKYFFIVAVMFFALTYPLMKLAGRLEARIRARGFAHD